ncbi:MAG TPA: hypothetical protein VIV27_08080 [Halioglobus sp.]
MDRGAGRQGRVAPVMEPEAFDECVAGPRRSRMLEAGGGTAPIIEISDKDYRSFCLPCYALDDTGDDKPEGEL